MNIQIVRNLVDPVMVSSLLVDQEFIKMVLATKRKDKRMVHLLTNSIERRGYPIKVIIAALERVK